MSTFLHKNTLPVLFVEKLCKCKKEDSILHNKTETETNFSSTSLKIHVPCTINNFCNLQFYARLIMNTLSFKMLRMSPLIVT